MKWTSWPWILIARGAGCLGLKGNFHFLVANQLLLVPWRPLWGNYSPSPISTNVAGEGQVNEGSSTAKGHTTPYLSWAGGSSVCTRCSWSESPGMWNRHRKHQTISVKPKRMKGRGGERTNRDSKTFPLIIRSLHSGNCTWTYALCLVRSKEDAGGRAQTQISLKIILM